MGKNPDSYIPADVLMRRERQAKLIEEVDIPMRNFLHSGKEIPETLIKHRQALLDVPQNNTPDKDENGQLTNVHWPTKPE